MPIEIKYQPVWGKLYIFSGLLFGLLFIFGALVLVDFSLLFNLIASIIVVYIGYAMLKSRMPPTPRTKLWFIVMLDRCGTAIPLAKAINGQRGKITFF